MATRKALLSNMGSVMTISLAAEALMFSGLPTTLNSKGGGYTHCPMTNKGKKNRKANKRAKQARKKNR